MFNKILIANRGEIACRIVQTARRLGVATVAVYADADARARHVKLADEAVHIGGSAPAESYLRIDRIIDAARATGAQAIHPGYGFLSENPDFVEACEAVGLVFIGPSAAAIRAMGLKDAAKALMEEAGVPVVPGYHGSDQSDARLARAAEDIGYPVLIKAVAGGGGKGMRLVEGAPAFEGALQSARNEAQAAFGNADVLIEKFVNQPRHVEVQVFGDGQGAVHLSERDCSLQRRHQKVIEEAPAPGMTVEMREAMGQAAVSAARAIGYSGAGTVEFIVDGSEGLRSDRFWFMEMNTRLQVEHPVTEAITGIDLVEWQLRVAAGECIPLDQEEIAINGHAVEARLYAEDPENDFLPVTGRLAHLRFPDGVRVDTGVEEGDTISPFYDPMVAKLTAHGPTRDVAFQALQRAIEQTEIAGTTTNRAFLARLCAHDRVRHAQLDTGLIGAEMASLVGPVPLDAGVVALAAVAAYGPERIKAPLAGFTLWAPLVQTIALSQGDTLWQAFVSIGNEGAVWVEVEGRRLNPVCIGGRWQVPGHNAALWSDGSRVAVFGAQTNQFDIVDPLDRLSEGQGGSDVVLAPMPGRVTGLFVTGGALVTAGTKLATLEAMKMEHTLVAPRDGVISEVLVELDSQVEAQAALITLQPAL